MKVQSFTEKKMCKRKTKDRKIVSDAHSTLIHWLADSMISFLPPPQSFSR